MRLIKHVGRLPTGAGVALIRVYQSAISWMVGPACRHLPSCSAYAETAVSRFGLWAGGWMTLARLLRCHPWGTHGLDFVPEKLSGDARWYAPWRYGYWRRTCRPDLGPAQAAG